jgi:hypothetical protein
MRFTPTSCLPSILWIACALAVAPPAVAWDPTPCDGIGGVREYRSDVVRALMNIQNGSTPEKFDGLLEKYMTCRTGQNRDDQRIFDRCLINVGSYLAYLTDPGLGLVNDENQYLPNDAYEKSYEQVLQIPKCLENNTGRLKIFDDLQATNLSDLTQVGRTVADIKQACKPLPTIVLPYVSPATDAIDEAPKNGPESDNRGRIVVWIGEDKISHYVQFTVNANPKSNMSRPRRVQASVVKVDTTVYKVGDIFFKKAYIFDWERDRSTNSFVYDKQFGNFQHCYACHLNGVIAIHPFRFGNQGDPPDIAKSADTLGANYSKWLSDLNREYGTAAQAMNQQIRKDSVRQEDSTELDIPTLVVNAPQPSTYVASTDPLKPGSCGKAIGNLLLPTEDRWKGCNVCHQNRGKPLYNVNLTDGLIAEYILGGFMPPNITAFLDRNQVERNGGTDRQLNEASQCVIADVHRRLTQVLELPECK